MQKLAIIVVLSLMAVPATAAPRRVIPWETYAGLSYQGAALSHGSLAGVPANLSTGMNAHIGERFGRLAVELGYSRSEAENSVLTSTATGYQSKISIAGPTLDFIGYMPVGGGFSLAGTLGASYFKGKGSNLIPTAPITVSRSEIGGRAGGGFEWRMVEPFSVNVMARYQTASFGGLAKDGIVYTAGFNFYF